MVAQPDIAQSDIAQAAPEPPAADAWDERKLAILSELAEAGLEIALSLKTRIVETAAASPGGEPDAGSDQACADLCRAFDRAARAVRMSIALRERVAKDAVHGAQATEAAAGEARAQRAYRVQRIVKRIARARHSDGPTCAALDRQAAERLLDPDITGDLEGRPIGALVARICADLGLEPRWTAMAGEAWAQDEITARPPCSPYAAWPDLPPDTTDTDLWDDDDPDGEDDPEPPERDPP